MKGLNVKKVICYIVGLFLLAIGINISKLSTIGISPVASIPRACEIIFHFTLGTTTMVIYCLFVLLQVVVMRKDFKVINVLGIATTFVLSWFIDLTGSDPNAIGHLMVNVPKADAYLMKLLYELLGVFFAGSGVFLFMRTKLVPMPAEGFADAISQKSGLEFGDCKTFVDIGALLVALVLQLIFMGGLKSFTSPDVVVREGTFILAIGIGQLVKLWSHLIGKPLEEFLNK